jgi:hypothetical protein
MISRDLDLNFTANPLTGDINVKSNDDAIKQALKTLLLLSLYEKPFNSDLGPNIRGFLFENYILNSNKYLEEKIKNIIQKYEPRVKVKQIDVKPDVDSNAISVNVEYFVSGSRTQDLLLTLERTR